jgi:hypothetical protein
MAMTLFGMMTARATLRLALAGLLLAGAPACDGSSSGQPGVSPVTGGGAGGGGGGAGGAQVTEPPGGNVPPAPAIGQQIDRAGRDGIGHAVVDPFGLMALFSHQNRDVYNRAGDRAQWKELFAPRFRHSLGIWDGTDGTCGNQLAASATVEPSRYDALVNLLVDDVLLLDTSTATCTTYLAVELRLLGEGAHECGGRTPLMDTPDATMTFLAAGLAGRNADGTMALSDAINNDKDGAPSASEFPFLLPAGTGTPGTSTGGAVDPEQAFLVCANLAETRCARVYQCWGRDNIPADQRDAYAFDVPECTRRLTAECRGLSTAMYGPRCPADKGFDPAKLRACERTYSLAMCEEIKAAGSALLPCGNLCLD